MAKLMIPEENPDLRAYLAGKYRKLFIRWAIAAAGMIVLDIVFIYGYFLRTLGQVNAVSISILLPILPFFVLKGHKLIFDSSWEAKVIKVEYTSRTEPITKFTFSRVMVRKHYCEIYAECANGNVKQLTLKLEDIRLSLPIEVGDRIIHFKGFAYPFLPDKRNLICPVCGNGNLESDTHCHICGLSIMKGDGSARYEIKA